MGYPLPEPDPDDPDDPELPVDPVLPDDPELPDELLWLLDDDSMPAQALTSAAEMMTSSSDFHAEPRLILFTVMFITPPRCCQIASGHRPAGICPVLELREVCARSSSEDRRISPSSLRELSLKKP